MGEWKTIDKMPKSIKKGMMRIYSFMPSSSRQGSNVNDLPRAYQFNPYMGSRVVDLYMDIPLPQTNSKEGI